MRCTDLQDYSVRYVKLREPRLDTIARFFSRNDFIKFIATSTKLSYFFSFKEKLTIFVEHFLCIKTEI